MDALRTFARRFTPARVARTRHWHREQLAREEAERTRDAARFARDFAAVPGAGRILLGRATTPDGNHYWVGMDPRTLLSQHAWWAGASGSGKSFGVLAVVLQALRMLDDLVLLVLDLKGELTQLLMTVIAGLPNVRELLPHLYVIRPFGDGSGPPDHLPCLNITQPRPGLPKEIQALNITSAISAALTADLGLRMERLAMKAVALAVALDLPLTQVIDWLQTPALFARDARRSGDRELIGYATEQFPQENASSIAALVARLDAFTIVGDTKLVLNAPSCISFSDILNERRAICLIDLGQPPAGAERLQRFWSNLFVRDLTRAILTRRVTAETSQALVPLEEFQEALDREQAAAFGRLLSLARYKRTAVWCINQAPAQLSHIDPSLVRLLHTNTGMLFWFRSALEDARVLAHALPPLPSNDPSGGRPAMIERVTQLPRRHLCFWVKTHRAMFLRSPRLDLEAIQRAADAAPREIHEGIARGVCSAPRSLLEARLAAARTHAAPHSPVAPIVIPPDDDSPFPRIG